MSEEPHRIILDGSGDRVFLWVSFFLYAVILFVATYLYEVNKDIDFRKKTIIGAALFMLAVSITLLFTRRYKLVIDKQDRIITASSQGVLGILPRVTTEQLDGITKLQTAFMPGSGGPRSQGSGRYVEFLVFKHDEPCLNFFTYRPRLLENTPFWSLRDRSFLAKNEEQDVIAPKIAKYLNVPLETRGFTRFTAASPSGTTERPLK